jgi:hypothetical protein
MQFSPTPPRTRRETRGAAGGCRVAFPRASLRVYGHSFRNVVEPPGGSPSARMGVSRSRLDVSDQGHLLVGGRRDEGSRPGSPVANHSRVFPLGRCRLPPIGFRAPSLSKRSPGGRQSPTVWLRLPTVKSLGLPRADAGACKDLRRGATRAARGLVRRWLEDTAHACLPVHRRAAPDELQLWPNVLIEVVRRHSKSLGRLGGTAKRDAGDRTHAHAPSRIEYSEWT